MRAGDGGAHRAAAQPVFCAARTLHSAGIQAAPGQPDGCHKNCIRSNAFHAGAKPYLRTALWPAGYEPDLDGVVAAVRRHADSAFPLRFMGFPSYTYFMLQKMEEQGMRLRLHRGSKIMLGGGWKQFYRQQVDKRTLYALAEKVLGVGQENIVEFFGAVEHPILYCACPNQHFHVPVYSRVIIRDVRTLAPLPHGNPGLVNLITPMVGATPVVSVLTDDLGVLHDGASCGCGIESPYLELLGRVGLKEIKTCAAGAAELLTGVNG